MGVYNIPPFLGIIRNVDTDPDENVDGDLLNWIAADRLWKRISGSALGSGHNHDDRYFREDEHIDSSSGTSDAGKPIKTTSDGRLSQTMRHLWDLLTKTIDYSMGVYDEVIFADASSGEITITLPPVLAAKGLAFHIKRINTNDNNVIVKGTI